MIQGSYEISDNRKIAKNIYKMILKGDTSAITAPGQFVNIKLDGFFLSRPISVCDWNEKEITLIYKTVGHGTEAMAAYSAGKTLDLLVGLGNGFSTAKSGEHALVVGGGVGVPPLFGLAKRLIAEGKNVTAVLGFNTAEEVFLTEDFKSIGVRVFVSTADGSFGTIGFVTDAMKEISGYSYFYACGPQPMLKAVYDFTETAGELSFEERMGCGFGACMGCSCRTKYGNKRICKDGPVLEKEEIIW